MQSQHFTIHHDVYWPRKIKFSQWDRFSFSQGMPDVRTVVKSGQIADKSQPSDRPPADILNQTAVHFSMRRDHHCPAGELAVIKSEKQTAPPVEIGLSVQANGEWPPLESCQPQKNRNDVPQLSPVMEAPSAQGGHVRREPHAQQIDVVDDPFAVPQPEHVTSLSSPRQDRLDGMFDAAVAEIAQE